MCRSHSYPHGGRRCKNTEEERIAKANYRSRKRLIFEYQDQLSDKPSEAPTSQIVVAPGLLKEAKITALHKIISAPQGEMPDSEYHLKLSAAYIELGEVVAEEMKAIEKELEIKVQVEKNIEDNLVQSLEAASAAVTRVQQEQDEVIQEVYRSTGVTRQAYPVITDRNSKLMEDFPEEWQKLLDAESATQAASDAFREAIRERNHHSILKATSGDSPEILDLMEKRRQSYIEALESVGVEFSKDQKIVSDEKSNKKAEKVVNDILKFFPKQWVADSNSSRPMIIKLTKGRAHYSSSAAQFVNIPKVSSYRKPSDWVPDLNDPKELTMVEIDQTVQSDGYVHHKEEITGRTYRFKPANFDEKLWLHTEHEHYSKITSGMTSYEPSNKEGWEAYEIEAYDYSLDPPQLRKHTRYRKQKVRRVLSNEHARPELTVSGDNDLERKKVAVHEFSHRAEATTSRLSTAQKAFLAYRSKQYTENPETLTTIGGRASEIGYKDNFASHYVGREYNNDKHYEILSTGMETILYGSYGSFHGRDGYSKDREHQNFILGLLASSAIKPENTDTRQ